MYQYTLTQWLFLFYLYCFFGWCFESAYVSVKQRKPVNRGFMRGPFLPLYGFGAILLLAVSIPCQGNILLTALAGCIAATALEYVTGVIMEALFKVRYWDYSNQKLNFHGYICLSSSIAWAVLTVLLTKFIHRPVEHFMYLIPAGVLGVITFVLTILLAADFALSFKSAMDLRQILLGIEKAKEEMEKMQHRLDALVAFVPEERELEKEERQLARVERQAEREERQAERQQERVQRLDELKENLDARFAHIQEQFRNNKLESSDESREELGTLRTRYAVMMEKRKDYREGHLGFYKGHMVRNNPGMTSRRFKDALDEIKAAAERKKEK